MRTERIGFIGLGIMGWRMAANLAAAGHDLTVYNRTQETAVRFAAEHGAEVAPSPRQLAAVCSIVFTMVVDGDQVRALLLGPEGVSAGAAAGTLCVDCSTIGPAAAVAIASELADRGIGFIDAPVTGSAPRAQDATLTIMAGGDAEAFARSREALESMGRLVLHVGAVGQGQTIKLINNAVAAANTATATEALLVADAAGVDLDALVAVMESGSGNSAALSLKQAPIRRQDFETLFKLDHMLKDVRLCIEQSEVPFPAAERVRADLEEASADGFGDADFCALSTTIERRLGRAFQKA